MEALNFSVVTLLVVMLSLVLLGMDRRWRLWPREEKPRMLGRGEDVLHTMCAIVAIGLYVALGPYLHWCLRNGRPALDRITVFGWGMGHQK